MKKSSLLRGVLGRVYLKTVFLHPTINDAAVALNSHLEKEKMCLHSEWKNLKYPLFKKAGILFKG